MEILIGIDWTNELEYSNISLLQFYSLIFQPIGCIIINQKNSEKINLQNVLIKEITNSNTSFTNLYLETNGAEICIPYKEQIIIITGIVIKDNLNLCKFNNNLGLELKIKKISDSLEFSDLSNSFKTTYINNLSLRDLLLYENEQLIDIIIDDYNQLQSIKNNGITELIKKFMGSSNMEKRNIIKLLLLDENDDKTQYLSSILTDVINIEKDIIKNSNFRTDVGEIFKSLQWNLQSQFLHIFKNIKKINDIKENNEETEDITYERKIKALNAPDNVKQKGMEKLKEFKNSKDNGGSKAASYLDGLLKVPFGEYKQEQIINFLSIFKEKLSTLVKLSHDKIMIYISDNCHIPKKIKKAEKLLDLLELGLNDKLNTEKKIDDFLMKFNKELLKNLEISKVKKNKYDINTAYKNSISNSQTSMESSYINSPRRINNENISTVDLINEMQKIKNSIIEKNTLLSKNLENINVSSSSFLTNNSSKWQELVSKKRKANNPPFINVSKKMKEDILLNIPSQNDIKEKNNQKNQLLNQINQSKNDDNTNCINDIILKIKEKYLEWMEYKQNKINYLNNVQKTLDDSVYGHKEAKKQLERIVAQWINGDMNGVVLGIQGPPGTGKTTLCKKGLSHCLKDENGKPRPFAFLPLGGSSDGSTLEGHSYTYVGSTWGRIVDILIETKCMNPIIYIDELDKVSNTERGREIIGILTHLTDSSQNKEFCDKYFSGIKFDLSKALIVFSYNDSSLIDRILRDRILEIRTKPLTKTEKVEIVSSYLMPEITKNVGYNTQDIRIKKDSIEYLVDNYTYEGGVRKLKEKLLEIIRELNLRRIRGDKKYNIPININNTIIDDILDHNNKLLHNKTHTKSAIGIMNGLYATAVGIGGLTRVECFRTVCDRKYELELTGQQGDVMKESVKVARTIATNLLPDDIKTKLKEEMEETGPFGLHVHCPEGATPKDGPSAGGVMTLTILSQLSGVPIKNNVAMTGEIDLNGTIRAIGGVYSKLQGAKNAGCNLVLLPKDNEKDLNQVCDEVKLGDDFKVILVSNIYEAIPHVFEKNNIKFKKFGINV
jgi:ATP-dependent Lon protease